MRTALLSFESDLVRINGGSGKGCSGRGGGGREIEGGVVSAKYRESSACYELTMIFAHFVIYILFVCFLMKIVQKREEGRRAALTTK